MPTRFLINQCQIIIFLILKSDIIENSRIVLRGIVLTVPSNQIKVTFIIIYPPTWYICDFFLFHTEIKGKCGWIIGGRGAKGILPPPLSNYWGPPPGPPLPTPMSGIIEVRFLFCKAQLVRTNFLYPFYEIKSFSRALRNTDHEVSVPKCPGKGLFFISQGQLFQINYINTG